MNGKTKNKGIEFDGSYYREIGDFLGENYLQYEFARGTEHEVEFLVDLMGLSSGMHLLDVGCGPGRHSLALARKGVRMTGVDISPRFVQIASEQAARESLPATFLLKDARELGFSGEFDAAICLCEGAFGLAGSLDNHRKVLQGVRRALKPGGLFVLTAIHAFCEVRMLGESARFDPYTNTSVARETVTNPEGDTKEVTFYVTGFTYRELSMLFEEAGFEVLDAYGCIAGSFSRKPLELGDYEIMMIGRAGF